MVCFLFSFCHFAEVALVESLLYTYESIYEALGVLSFLRLLLWLLLLLLFRLGGFCPYSCFT